MAAVAARSALRSATASARNSASRLSVGVKPRGSSSPFRVSPQKPLSARIFRCPAETSVMSMFPYHTATASALLTSMLFVVPRGHGWTIEDR